MGRADVYSRSGLAERREYHNSYSWSGDVVEHVGSPINPCSCHLVNRKCTGNGGQDIELVNGDFGCLNSQGTPLDTVRQHGKVSHVLDVDHQHIPYRTHDVGTSPASSASRKNVIDINPYNIRGSCHF